MSHSIPNPSAFKVCSKCGKEKPLAEFHKGNDKDGLRHACKPCTNAQNRSIYYQNRDAHLASKRRYRSECYDARLETVRSYDARNTNKRRAHRAVKKAVASGLMPRAAECRCAHCGMSADIYHHESYAPDHWLDVEPVCRKCHGEIHRVH